MFEQIDESRLDILREICTIGAGHAATALSQLIGPPDRPGGARGSRFERVQEVPRIAGGAETVVDGLYFRILGDARGVILLIFPEESARRDGAPGRWGASTLDPEDALSVSAMREIGNILASAFLSAIGQLSGLSLIPSVPGYAATWPGRSSTWCSSSSRASRTPRSSSRPSSARPGRASAGTSSCCPTRTRSRRSSAPSSGRDRAGSRGVSRDAVGIADLRTGGPGRGARRHRAGFLRRPWPSATASAGAARSRTSCCRSQSDGRRRAGENMNKYADVAVPEAVRSLENIGCRRADLEAKIAGGASIFDLGRGAEGGDIGGAQRRGGGPRAGGGGKVPLLASDVGGARGARRSEFSIDDRGAGRQDRPRRPPHHLGGAPGRACWLRSRRPAAVAGACVRGSGGFLSIVRNVMWLRCTARNSVVKRSSFASTE